MFAFHLKTLPQLSQGYAPGLLLFDCGAEFRAPDDTEDDEDVPEKQKRSGLLVTTLKSFSLKVHGEVLKDYTRLPEICLWL